jgi:hypothetical protein
MNPAFDEANSLDGPENWIEPPLSASSTLHKSLVHLDQSLRCEICSEFFKLPVSLLPCHHTFCNCCIRESFKTVMKGATGLKKTATCPKCGVAVDTSGADFQKCFVPNHALERVVDYFQTLRGDLKKQLTECAETNNSSDNSNNKKRKASTDPTATETVPSASDSSCNDDDDDEDYNYDASQTFDARKPAAARKIRSKKPRPVYTSYKSLKKLRELCAKEGLSSTGTEKELVARHQAFITLYNAECDGLHPRSLAEIIAHVHETEQARSRQARRCGPSVLDTTCSAAMNDGFKKLCAKMKQRQRREMEQRDNVNPCKTNNAKQPYDNDATVQVDEKKQNASEYSAWNASLPTEASLLLTCKSDEPTDEVVENVQNTHVNKPYEMSPRSFLLASNEATSFTNENDAEQGTSRHQSKPADLIHLEEDDSSDDFAWLYVSSHLSTAKPDKSTADEAESLPYIIANNRKRSTTDVTNNIQNINKLYEASPHPAAASRNSVPNYSGELLGDQQSLRKRNNTTATATTQSGSKKQKQAKLSVVPTKNRRSSTASSSSNAASWSCPACTFLNVTNYRKSRSACEMCATQRPVDC